MHARSFAWPAIVVAVAACGGQVVPEGTTKPTPTTEPTTQPTTPPTTTVPTTTPTTTPTTVPTSDPPPPIACLRTADKLSIQAGGNDVCTFVGPTGPSNPAPVAVEGQITGTSPTSVTLQTCPPNANCIHYETFSVTAPGLDLTTLPLKSYARVVVTAEQGWGCTQEIEITSLGAIDGLKNPIGDPDGILYLAAGDGTTATHTPLLSLALAANGCLPGVASCSNHAPDDYGLMFTWPGIELEAPVAMGQTQTTTLPGPNGFIQQYSERDLRSFYDGECDADYDYAWWAIRTSEYGAL